MNLSANPVETTATNEAFVSIVEGIRQRRPEAMEQLYTIFSKGIRCLFARQLGTDEADDGVQQTLMEAISAIQRNDLAHPERLAGFIRVIAKRRVAAVIKARIRTRNTESPIDVLSIPVAERAASPERAAFQRQTRNIASRVLASMKPREREVLTRFYVNDETEEGICDSLGLTAHQFKNTKHRAKNLFAALCQEQMHLHKRNPVWSQQEPSALRFMA